MADRVVRAEEGRVEAGGDAVAAASCGGLSAWARVKGKEKKRTFVGSVNAVQDVPRVVLEAVRALVPVKRATRLAELNHARLEVVERTFDEALLFLVVRKEVVPERMLRRRSVASLVLAECARRTLLKTLGLPRTTRPYLARVRATLRRRGSLRNPIPWCSLLLTHETMM